MANGDESAKSVEKLVEEGLKDSGKAKEALVEVGLLVKVLVDARTLPLLYRDLAQDFVRSIEARVAQEQTYNSSSPVPNAEHHAEIKKTGIYPIDPSNRF